MSSPRASLFLLASAVALAACAAPSVSTDLCQWVVPATSAAAGSEDALSPAPGRDVGSASFDVPDGSALYQGQRAPQRRREARRSPESRQEVLIGGAGSGDGSFRAGGGQLALSVGYYLTEVVLVAVRQNFSTSKADSGSAEIWDAATRFALDYHFPLADVVPQVAPYLGANVGYIYGDSVGDTMVAGPEVGLKYYVKPDVFLQLGVEYEFTFDSPNRIDRAFSDGSFFFGLGFGACF